MTRSKTMCVLAATALASSAAAQPTVVPVTSAPASAAASAPATAPGAAAAPYGIEIHRTGHAYFYIVPVAGGVVLVDTGAEDDATQLLAAIAGRPVLAILLTHGHRDHYQGAHRLGEVPTYAHRRDILRVVGREHSRGPVPGLFDRIRRRPTPPQRMIAVRDGEHLSFGEADFAAVHLPGHTAGGMAWLYRDVLFSGDAILGGEKLALSPDFFSDDNDRARSSAKRLLNVPFKVMLDGHSGLTVDADAKLRDFVK